MFVLDASAGGQAKGSFAGGRKFRTHMAGLIGTVSLVAAAILIVHAGYSTNHFFDLVRLRFGDVQADVPVDVFAEVGLGLVLAVVAAITFTEPFKPLHMSTEVKAQAWESMRSRPDFHAFMPLSRSEARAQAEALGGLRKQAAAMAAQAAALDAAAATAVGPEEGSYSDEDEVEQHAPAPAEDVDELD